MEQNIPQPLEAPSIPDQQKHKKDYSSMKSYVEKEIASLSRRIKIVEEQIDTLSSKVQLTEKDTIEKHKSSIKRINKTEGDMREIRGKLQEINELTMRIADRLKDLAPKEDIEILERYSKWWQPLSYVTKKEVMDMINKNKEGD
ncbi:MAG: hypothetical protein JSW73_04810 [Candidatus Woesearchaeota archaeon]|nr:MAG: hypothetical protein JSW73_04810 [Candidatus Woesearchaeota archaeon]